MKKTINILLIFIFFFLSVFPSKTLGEDNTITLIQEKDFSPTANIKVYDIGDLAFYNNLKNSNNVLKFLAKIKNSYINKTLESEYGSPIPNTITKPNENRIVIHGLPKDRTYIIIVEENINLDSKVFSIDLVDLDGNKILMLKENFFNTGSLKIIKKEYIPFYNGLKLSEGAQFSLYKYDRSSGFYPGEGIKQNKEPFVTNDKGEFVLKNLLPGNYYLVEEIPADNNLVLNPDVVNSHTNRLTFNIDEKRNIEYPENSILKNGYIINYTKPEIEKTKESLTTNGPIYYNINVTIPGDADKYSSFQIIDKPSASLNIDYNSLRIDVSHNTILYPGDYTLSKKDDGGFIITLKDTCLKKLAGKKLNINYIARANDKQDKIPVNNKAILNYIDTFGEFQTTDNGLLNVRILKVDEMTNKPLEGATFIVKNSANEYLNQSLGENKWGAKSKATKFVSDKDGEIIIENLKKENLTLIEVVPPKGYKLLDSPYEFVPDDNGVITIPNTPKRTPNKELPTTGLNNSIIMTNILYSIIACAAIFLLYNKKLKDKNNEKIL